MPRHHQEKSGSSEFYDKEAFCDKLTQPLNQHLLYGRLEQVMTSSKRTGRYIALMYIGLIDFHPLNNHYGQKIGDSFLIEVANRLKDNVREVDTVSRTSCDEFVVEPNELTCEKTQSVTQAHIIAEKIRAALTGSYPIIIRYEKTEDTIDEYNCEISMGIVVFVNDNKNRDDVLEWAERSMHKAKKSESSQICFNDTYI